MEKGKVMSLDYDLTGIADRETVCFEPDPDRPGERRMTAVTYAITRFGCLATGIGEITEANAAEWYARIRAVEKIGGSLLVGFDNETDERIDQPITPAQVRAHIGLRTNVFPKVTDAAFRAQLWRRLKEDGAYDWEQSTKDDPPAEQA